MNILFSTYGLGSNSLSKAYECQNEIMSLRQKNQTVDRSGLPRTLQWVIALLTLLALSPVILITVVILKIESDGPALFHQIRVGKNGLRFRCFKFRSMYLESDRRFKAPNPLDSDRDGPCKKYFNDPRVTPFGRIIRKLSIDELPQLFNVLKGEMALIGPRPALLQETDLYELGSLERLDCKPGITGLWQVSGRANTNFEQQITLDLEYVNKQSIAMDLYLLVMTVPAVLSTKGAY